MNKRSHIIIFLAILFLAISFRITGLDRSFVLDEFKTIKFASLKMDELLEAIKKESYPPLSYALLSIWLNASRSEIWIRLLFVMFGLASVVLVYLIGRLAANIGYALLAMLFMALMPIQVWASQYARGIAPAIFFLLLSTLFFLRLIKAGPLRICNPNALGYVVSSIASIYSFYFVFFIIAIQNLIYIFLNRKNIGNIFKWLVLQLALIIAFLPWLGSFLEQLKDANILMNFSLVYPTGLRVGGLPVGTYMRCVAGSLGIDQAFFVHTSIIKTVSPKIIIAAIFVFLMTLLFAIWFLVNLYKRSADEKYPKDGKFSTREVLVYFSLFAIIPVILSIILNLVFKTPLALRYFAVSSAFLIFVYASALYSIKDKKPLFYFVAGLFIVLSIARLVDFANGVIDYKNSSLFLKNNIRGEEGLLFIGGENAYEYYSGSPKNYISSIGYMRRYGTNTGYTLEYLVNEQALRASTRPFKILWIYNSSEKMIGLVDYVLGLVDSFGYGRIAEYKFKNISVFKYAQKIE